MKIVLASTSPRRKMLMEWLGVDFEAIPADLDERLIRDDKPDILTQKLAAAKARIVAKENPDQIVIGSDAVVMFGGQILEKAENTLQQKNLIMMQKGKPAEVYTSICVIDPITKREIIKTMITPYVMANRTEKEIDEYMASGIGADKAGGYGLQDNEGMFLESYNGCYANLLGFPICEVSEILKSLGVKIEINIKQIVKDKTGKDC